MAKGFQDFWGANLADIFQQSISYLTQIAHIGITDFIESIFEDLTGQILYVGILSKGIVMGGIIEVTESTDLLANKVKLVIDGEETMAYTFNDFLTKNIHFPNTWLLYGLVCDTVNNKGVIGITAGIRFDHNFKIYVEVPEGVTSSWIIRLMVGMY